MHVQSTGVCLQSLLLIRWGCGEFRLVSRVSRKWESFGILLGIPYNELEVWKDDSRSSDQRWLRVMQHWLDGKGPPDYPPTWDGLYLLLQDVECAQVAEELRKAVSML